MTTSKPAVFIRSHTIRAGCEGSRCPSPRSTGFRRGIASQPTNQHRGLRSTGSSSGSAVGSGSGRGTAAAAAGLDRRRESPAVGGWSRRPGPAGRSVLSGSASRAARHPGRMAGAATERPLARDGVSPRCWLRAP